MRDGLTRNRAQRSPEIHGRGDRTVGHSNAARVRYAQHVVDSSKSALDSNDRPGALVPPRIDHVREGLAMARLRGALFGEDAPATLERYAILQKLGEGAYGAVYSAWDPRLDRKVALKVLHADASSELEREARALAKLTHPNIVAVHDVGEANGQLFLAMEFVDGRPLSALDVNTLGWRRVVVIYRQAAAGLAAAHQAGIVHRDFKPANAILGHDGRVRVLDFGLARPGIVEPHAGVEAAAHTRVAGTPRYMAPEQHRGERLDARTDQYCFCAALWEALYGAPAFEGDTMASLLAAKATAPSPPSPSSIPPKLLRALQRGLSPDPDARFASMDALDAVLGNSLRRHWKTIGAATAVTLALGVGIALGGTDRPCANSDAPPGRWNTETMQAIHHAFAQTGLPHASTSGTTVHHALEQWAQTWGQARKNACMLHTQGIQSDEGLDLRTTCLAHQETRFNALIDVLLDADATTVERSVQAAAALPDPQRCDDLDALRHAHPIPKGSEHRVDEANAILARGQAELDAGHYQRATDLVTPVLDQCDAPRAPLVHPPTCIEAEALVGDSLGYLGHHDPAVSRLRAAAIAAQADQLPVVFGRAAASLTWELGEVDAAFDLALAWADLGVAALSDQSALTVEVSLLNNKASVLATAGRWDEAVATHHALLERIETVRGSDDSLAMMPHANLANIDNRRGQVVEAEAAYARAIAIGVSTLGETHPRVLTTRQNRAGMRVREGRTEEGLADLREILRAQQETLGDQHPDMAATLTNIALAELAVDDPESALRDARAATALLEQAFGQASHLTIDSRLAEVDALVGLGQASQAVQLSEATASLAETTLGSKHASTAYAMRSWGLALLADGKPDDATLKLEAAADRFTALGMVDEATLTRDQAATEP